MTPMIEYADFRCGITWGQVRDELAQEQRTAKSCGSFMYVTRSTVLGRWRQHKLSAYAYYLAQVSI